MSVQKHLILADDSPFASFPLVKLFAFLLLQRTFGFKIRVVLTKCDNVLIIIILNQITTFRFLSNQPNVQT
jgi:hypothetical protein